MATNLIKNEPKKSGPLTIGGLMDQVFQNNMSRFFDDTFFGEDGAKSSAPVNVQETDTTYEVELIAPGLKKDDFKIDVSNDKLTVSFEHKDQSSENNSGSRWVRNEYRKQSFTRSFSLDNSLDANRATAEYTDGVLHLTIPKKENAQKIMKTIPVK